jgi:hypothetical protein
VNGSLPDSTPFVKRAFAGETIEGNCAATLAGQNSGDVTLTPT